ncbi:hypothetical protein NBRC3257_0942 [Gluconobacter thailandicus NBRC 3257]|uniref:Uncharacterized protein n=1 Tax=Gluconobacter thailandicus NBRC 3257 TaxID=1381097 RepID=A0ABQ0IUQ0_GLUTH|nr:hypothetical protein NBRC3255_0043 [Gluconobacter thailandicus NBRC 3255]GAD25943.1 hypothetical protein NBRC3257_0942 [Gluconobacter thailandicus NBRC 3257]
MISGYCVHCSRNRLDQVLTAKNEFQSSKIVVDLMQEAPLFRS